MTCSIVYALLRVRARNNYSMHSHPAARAPAAAADSSTTALFHARDLFARASTVLLLKSVRVAGPADRLTETGGRILPGKIGQGERGQRAWELGQPPCRSPPAGRVQDPCARRWPWGGEVVSQQKRAEKASFRLAARLLAACVDSSTRRIRERTARQVQQTRRQPRQRCTSPAHRITAHRPSLSTSKSTIVLSQSIGACLCLPIRRLLTCLPACLPA
jgi:hypothetical protein